MKINNIKLIIDGAHGAHLKGLLDFEFYKNCDSMVISTHKTMDALNQSAVVLNNNEMFDDEIKKYINMFQTSSPSYIILKSIEDAVEKLDDFKGYSVLSEIAKYNFLQESIIEDVYIDPWKITVFHKNKGYEIFEFLKENNIYCEYYDLNSALLMLSPYNSKDDLEEISHVLERLNKIIKLEKISDFKKQLEDKDYYKAEKRVVIKENFKDEINKKNFISPKVISLEDSLGEISKNDIIIYPPGVIVIFAGEVIEKEKINLIIENIKIKKEIIGLDKENKISVIVKGEKWDI